MLKKKYSRLFSLLYIAEKTVINANQAYSHWCFRFQGIINKPLKSLLSHNLKTKTMVMYSFFYNFFSNPFIKK